MSNLQHYWVELQGPHVEKAGFEYQKEVGDWDPAWDKELGLE